MREITALLKKISSVTVLCSLAALSGCWYDSGKPSAAAASGASAATLTASKNSAPTVSGVPGTAVAVGSSYRFAPAAADADGDTLTYSVQNLPAWASFSAASGVLSGVPQAADVGSYPNITISVNDGRNTTALPAFAIAVVAGSLGTATVSWVAPTQNDDGTPIDGLSGYLVLYGKDSASLDYSSTVSDASATSFTVRDLLPGTWYFGVVSVSTAGVRSRISALASKTIG